VKPAAIEGKDLSPIVPEILIGLTVRRPWGTLVAEQDGRKPWRWISREEV
jgi:uncharacterized protein YbbK (DUF523 family)